jgi:hypothetical protein
LFFRVRRTAAIDSFNTAEVSASLPFGVLRSHQQHLRRWHWQALGFNFDRYDRELRRPFPSEQQFARESKVWQREHTIADAAKTTAPGLDNARPATSGR